MIPNKTSISLKLTIDSLKDLLLKNFRCAPGYFLAFFSTIIQFLKLKISFSQKFSQKLVFNLNGLNSFSCNKFYKMLSTKDIIIKLILLVFFIQGCSTSKNFINLPSDYDEFNLRENIAEKQLYFKKQKLSLVIFSEDLVSNTAYNTVINRLKIMLRQRGQYKLTLPDNRSTADFADMFKDYFAPELIPNEKFNAYFEGQDTVLFIKPFYNKNKNDGENKKLEIAFFVYDNNGQLINRLSKQKFTFDTKTGSFIEFNDQISPFLNRFFPITGSIIDTRDYNKYALLSAGRSAGVFKNQKFRLYSINENNPADKNLATSKNFYAIALVTEVFEDFSIISIENSSVDVGFRLGDFAFSGAGDEF